MNYGIPYKGSKNKLAEKILAKLPTAGTLYDVFAGGMAISHAALQGNKFKKVVANDINGEMGRLFVNAMCGAYENDEAWVSREDFFMFKEADPYIKIAWSFGLNGDSYLYSKEIEPVKKAMHKVCFAKSPIGRKTALKDLGDELKKIEEEKKRIRRLLFDLCKEYEVECVKRVDGTPDVERLKKPLRAAMESRTLSYMRNALQESGKTQADVDRFLGNQMAGHYFGKSQFMVPTQEHYERMKEIIPGLVKDWAELNDNLSCLSCLSDLEGLDNSLDHLESFSNTNRIKGLQYISGKEKLQTRVGSYKDLNIEKDSVIYCDPPYINTSGYGCEFDHNEFYDWLEGLEVPVFISEYWMPEDRFVCVAEFDHTQTLSGTGAKKVKERLFVPKSQYKESLKLF